MQIAKCKSRIAVACILVALGTSSRTSAFTFDDIEFWVGTGPNRAAMVIDWSDTAADPPALVWGYRWDGEANGNDMFQAVITADERLFAKLAGPPDNSLAVYGFGYDADNDGEFGVDDATVFDDAGIAFTSPADLGMSTDSGDYYAEGWFTGFWHYGVAPMNPYAGGSWSDTPVGAYARALSDGAWDSWVFTPSFNFASFAVNPQAAPSPFPPGDFDQDGDVTAADFDVWKSTFGSTTDLAADASGNGVVDAADYTIWRDRFSAGSVTNLPTIVPEPSSIIAAVGVLLFLPIHTLRARRLAS